MNVEVFKYYHHAGCPDWGLGRVIVIDGNYIEIYFQEKGLIKLDLEVAGVLLKKTRLPPKSSREGLNTMLTDSKSALEKFLSKRSQPISSPDDQNFYYENFDEGIGNSVAGTGRRAPDYLKRHLKKMSR